jgi:ribosomal protein S18 acetylase RimI-like enzyme
MKLMVLNPASYWPVTLSFGPVLVILSVRIAASHPASGFSRMLNRLGAAPARLAQLLRRLVADIFQPSALVCNSLPAGFKLQRARFWELGEVARLDHLVFPKNTTRCSTLLYLLRLHLFQDACLYTVRHEGRMVAIAFLGRLRGTRTGFVSHVGVDPAFRRQGLAERLMVDAVLPQARRRGMLRLVLTVSADQQHLQDFYNRLGFASYPASSFDVAVPEGHLPMCRFVARQGV